MDSLESVARLATRLRVDSIRSTARAGSGHPTSSLSAADLLAVLLARHFRFRMDEPDHPGNDRLVLSKGHAAPLLYAALKAIGVISDEEMMSLRSRGSRVEGHPVPGLPMVDAATGSLGQGLSVGLGMAMGLRRLGSPARTWVVLGDSEMAEGSVWEAMASASFHQVSHIVAILDMNRLGQRGPTMEGWDAQAYLDRADAFGWNSISVDGHDVRQVDEALRRAGEAEGPTLVVARTVKGKGVSFLEDQPGMHGTALDASEEARALEELGDVGGVWLRPQDPWTFFPDPPPARRDTPLPTYSAPVATRTAFGDALLALVERHPELLVLDAEVSNSTRTEGVAEQHPDRFIELYIAEQNMMGVAVGLQAVGFLPVAATFAAFLTRAHDFVRMAAIGGARLVLCGSHAGASIGEDGPSQMGLEDLAMMRAIPGSTVLYPADGNATVALLSQLVGRDGISYLRTTRGTTPLLYSPGEELPIGGSRELRRSDDDVATIVSAGITLFEALRAADLCAEAGLPVRVIDAYSVKPIDRATLRRALEETGRMVVVEDHHPEGGLGEAVLSAVAGAVGGPVSLLAVRGVPGSASPEEQLEAAGIDADAILREVRRLVEAEELPAGSLRA